MPLNKDRQIFQSSSGTQSWGDIKGQTVVMGQGALRRGGDYKLGAQAVANINNLLNKWAKLKILGNAEVSLLAQVQIQTPLNLFDEAGLAGRLQAVLKAAVGAGLSINLTLGQLLDILKTKPSGQGLSGELIELLLDESELEGFLYAQFAVGFMAYANFVILGSLHKTAAFEEPGFKFVYDAGMGFIAGGGYRGGVTLHFPDPGELITRYGNRLIEGIVNKVIGTQQEQALMLGSMLKIGVKSAYRTSELLHEETGIDTEKLAQTVLTIMGGQFHSLFLLSSALFFKEETLRLINQASLLTGETEETVRLLIQFDGFEFVPSNPELFARLERIGAIIQDDQIKKSFIQAVSALWASALLLPIAIQAAEVEALPAYTGTLPVQPSLIVLNATNLELDRPADAVLNQQDVLQFLLGSPLGNLQNAENFRDMAAILSPAVPGTSPNAFAFLFSSSFPLPAGGGSFSSTLGDIQQAFDRYVDSEISARKTVISNTLSNETEIRILFEQALIPCIQLTSDVLIPEIVNGFQHFDRTTMEEALSSTLLTMLGRSVIHVINGIQTTVNERIDEILRRAAKEAAIALKPLGAEEIMRKPLEEAVKLIADLLAHVPSDLQEKLFQHALDIFTPIEGSAVEYANHLEQDPMWMPQLEQIEGIAGALIQHVTEHMISFALKIIPALFQALIDELLAYIEKLLDVLVQFLQTITKMITQLINEKLVDELVDPVMELAEKAADALTFNILDVIGAGQVKDAFFAGLRKSVEGAIQLSILPPVHKIVERITFNPRKLVELCRKVSNLTYGAFDQIFNDFIFGEIQDQLSKNFSMKNFRLNIEVPVSFSFDLPWPLGTQTFSHTFRLTDILFPSSLVQSAVMKLIRNNIKLGGTAEYLYELVLRIIQSMQQIEQYQKDMAEALQKYSS